jgi:hypothetical protein
MGENLLPASWQPYAKAVVAFLIAGIGVAVDQALITDDTASTIISILTVLATVFGVYEAKNAPQAAVYDRERGTTYRRS